ncbi:MAG: two-CW domain-containing protein [Candidatus Zixiibacteriota bacterium]
MTKKLNCWEYKNCGRENGGLMAPILGECPVPSYLKYDGLNGGIGAGRACWMVPHGLCSSASGSSVCSRRCYTCEFYKRVVFEQEESTCFKYTSIKD